MARPIALRVTYYFCPKCRRAVGFVADERDEANHGLTYGEEGFWGTIRVDRGTAVECECGASVTIPKSRGLHA
jgi:hypothetical protein